VPGTTHGIVTLVVCQNEDYIGPASGLGTPNHTPGHRQRRHTEAGSFQKTSTRAIVSTHVYFSFFSL